MKKFRINLNFYIMKSLFIFSALLLGSFSFAQVDLSKKEAFEAFKNSNVRKELNISLKDFEKYYREAKCISKHWKIKTSEMPIFQKKYNGFVEEGRFRQSLYGLGDTIFPSRDNEGKKTQTCNVFATSD